MLASFLKRDLRNLFRKDASPNFQAQNGLLSLRSRWRSVRSLEKVTEQSQNSRDVSHYMEWGCVRKTAVVEQQNEVGHVGVEKRVRLDLCADVSYARSVEQVRTCNST